eukprot:3546122-Amphidinium_carterae.1
MGPEWHLLRTTRQPTRANCARRLSTQHTHDARSQKARCCQPCVLSSQQARKQCSSQDQEAEEEFWHYRNAQCHSLRRAIFDVK